MCAVEWKALSEVFEMRGGYTPSTKNKDFWEDGILPWFRMEDIREKGNILSDSTLHITPTAVKKNGLFPQNSIILATSATIGVHALLTVPALSNQRFTAFYPNEKYVDRVNCKFAYYVFYLIDEWCKNNIVQGGFASVDMNGLKKYLFPIPSLTKQQEIVSHLDTFTTLIFNLESELDMRRKQYEHYRNQLLDFEGVEGVEWKTLGECIDRLKTGLNPRKNFVLNESENTIPYVTGKEIRNNKININNNTDRINAEALELINKRALLEKGLLLFASTGCSTVGRMAIIEEYQNDWGISETLYAIKINPNINTYYVRDYLNTLYAKRQYEPYISKGSVPHLKISDLLNVLMPIPSQEAQTEIVSKLDAFENLIQSLEQEIKLRKQQYEYYREKLLTFE